MGTTSRSTAARATLSPSRSARRCRSTSRTRSWRRQGGRSTPARPDNGADTVESLLESALGSAAADQPPADDAPAAEAGPPPYLPGAEPGGGQPPEPIGEIESVTEPVLAALQWAVDEAARS